MDAIHKPKGIYEKYMKRVFDIALSLIGLAVLWPVLLILTIVGSIAMKGNPFFLQERPGMIDKETGIEKTFRLIKFRTMTNEKDKAGKLLPDEKRLTRYGKFLRTTSCDELPEILNILKGDMSIVGPRPLMKRYLPYYSKEERRRHLVRPGLTGYAQIHGRNSLTWDERLALDIYYVDHITFLQDLKIVLGTVKTVLGHKGIELEDLGNLDDYRKAEPGDGCAVSAK